LKKKTLAQKFYEFGTKKLKRKRERINFRAAAVELGEKHTRAEQRKIF